MPLSSDLRLMLNLLLGRANLRLDTLTAERSEHNRLAALAAQGYFERPAFPVPPAVAQADSDWVLERVARYRERFASFGRTSTNPVGYSFNNDYFSSPDAEVLYTLLRELRPQVVLEVGSGNSTRVARQAILDGKLATQLIAIDPAPRLAVAHLVDRHLAERIEQSDPAQLAALLAPGDVLFIDSSHALTPGGDVAFLLLELVPRLAPGVFIHLHDIFLPYNYPRELVAGYGAGWSEQYLVQAMLSAGDSFEVLWAGYYAQRTKADFAAHFPQLGARRAASLWLRKRQN